jgi:hypothetical protein
MSCPSCTSLDERQFTAGMMIHSSGLKHIEDPGVLAFPQVSICLDCGASRFTTPGAELRALKEGTAASVSAA